MKINENSLGEVNPKLRASLWLIKPRRSEHGERQRELLQDHMRERSLRFNEIITFIPSAIAVYYNPKT